MRWTDLAICGLLAVATFLVYGQVAGFDFVGFDDRIYVAGNWRVAAGLSREGVVWAFTSVRDANWFPLTWLSHMLDVELHGLEPGGHHANNAILHGLNALILFGVLRALTGRVWPSAWVAALFAVHPLQVESVAWISERKNVLSTIFGLLAIGAYGGWVRRGGAARQALVALLMACSLMAKPMWVTLPCVLLLLDFWPLGRMSRASFGRRVAEKLPLFALAGASSALTLWAQAGGGAMAGADALPLRLRIANAVVSIAVYLRRLVWPDDLATFHPHPYLPALGGEPWTPFEVAGAALLVVGISAGVLWARRGPWTVGWLWFLGTLVPVLGLVQVGGQGMADRYVYVPAIGIFLAAAWGLAGWFDALRARGSRLAGLALAVPVLAVVAGSVAARAQVSLWRDSVTLFESTLEVTPRNPTLRYNLANALRARGELEAAIAHYRRALEVAPGDAKIHNNLGNALRESGRLEDAIIHYREAVRLQPGYAKAHNNLGVGLRALGRADEAIAHYRAALRSDPEYALAHYNLGNALGAAGDHEAAVESYRAALRAGPPRAEVWNHLGIAWRRLGRLEEAVAAQRRALAIDPISAAAHHDLAAALQLLGRGDEAIASYREALALAPEDAGIRSDLGTALHGEGRLDEAIAEYRRALALDPGHAAARRHLAAAESERAAR